MSRTAITLKFKMCLFLHEACCWAEKLFTDINLPPLMPDEDNDFGDSLFLDFRNDKLLIKSFLCCHEFSVHYVAQTLKSSIWKSVKIDTSPCFPTWIFQSVSGYSSEKRIARYSSRPTVSQLQGDIILRWFRISNHRGHKFPPSLTLLLFKTRIECTPVLRNEKL